MSYQSDANSTVRSPITIVSLELDTPVRINPVGRGEIVDNLDELTLSSGDTVLISSATLDPFELTDLVFDPPVTIVSDIGTTITAADNTADVPIKLVRCSGIIVSGFNLVSGVHNIHTVDCENVFFYNNDLSNAGKQPVFFEILTNNNFDNHELKGNSIHDSGVADVTAGEGVLVGSATQPTTGTMTNVSILENVIYNCTRNPILLKSNVVSATVDINQVRDSNIIYGGAINACMDEVTGKDTASIFITNNDIRDITTDSNDLAFRLSYIAVGNGQAEIYNNTLTCDVGSVSVSRGITTNQFFTSDNRDVYIYQNTMNGFDVSSEIVANVGLGSYPCNYYFSQANDQSNPNPPACTIYGIGDPSTWQSGDVICVNDAEIPRIEWDDLVFDPNNPVIIRTTNGTRITGSSFTDRECVRLRRCQGIIFEGGWELSNALYGWLTYDCNDIETRDLYVHDVGQEGIMDRISIQDVNLSGFRHIRPIVSRTGRRGGSYTEFGEGIYIGNGFGGDSQIGTMSGVYIEDPYITETTAEPIDIKAQVSDFEIKGGTIENIDLPYAGVISVHVDDAPAYDTVGLIDGITIRDIRSTDGFTTAMVAVGHGDITIQNYNFELNGTVNQYGTTNQYGIDIYQTFSNQNTRTIVVGDGSITGDGSHRWIRLNRSNAGTPGGLFGLLNFENTGDPLFWLDAFRDETVALDSGSVTSWYDRSSYGFNAIAGAGSVTLGNINGRNALYFNGSSGLTIANGPQFQDDCMMFMVLQPDVLTSGTALNCFKDQIPRVSRVAVGVDSGNVFFRHSEDSSQVEVVAPSEPMLLTMYRVDDQLFIDCNGTSQSNTLSVQIFLYLREWFIGSLDNSSEFFTGHIGEIKMYRYYDTDILEAERDRIALKWGINAGSFSSDNMLAITPVAWYDASDTTTITSSSNEVSEWRDKSGNNRHFAQATSSLMPRSGEDQVSGLNVITSAGEKRLELATSFSGKTVVAAFVTDGLANNEFTFFGGEIDGNPSADIKYASSGDVISVSLDGNSFGSATGVYAMNGGTFSSNGSNFDTSADTIVTNVVTIQFDTAIDVRVICGRSGFTNSGLSKLCEVIWFDRDLNTDDRSFAEQYLMNKWTGDFSILNFSPVAWYDASDTNTITASGNDMSTWNDKSGNGHNMTQATQAYQPTTGVSTVNGLNAIRAIGEKYMSTTGFTGRTVVAAFRTDGLAENEFTFFGGEADGSPEAAVKWSSSTPVVSFDGDLVNNGSGVYSLNGGSYSSSGSNVDAANLSDNVLNIITMRFDADFTVERILGRSGYTNPGRSRLCEVIWFDRVLSDSDKFSLENYLNEKWGGLI